MESISIPSFAAFFLCMALGAYWHYRKVRKTGRHVGNLWTYLTSRHKDRSMYMGVALLGESWVMATTGTADFINPELIWAFLRHWDLHIPSIAVAWLAVKSGYAWDSHLSKGSEE